MAGYARRVSSRSPADRQACLAIHIGRTGGDQPSRPPSPPAQPPAKAAGIGRDELSPTSASSWVSRAGDKPAHRSDLGRPIRPAGRPVPTPFPIRHRRERWRGVGAGCLAVGAGCGRIWQNRCAQRHRPLVEAGSDAYPRWPLGWRWFEVVEPGGIPAGHDFCRHCSGGAGARRWHVPARHRPAPGSPLVAPTERRGLGSVTSPHRRRRPAPPPAGPALAAGTAPALVDRGVGRRREGDSLAGRAAAPGRARPVVARPAESATGPSPANPTVLGDPGPVLGEPGPNSACRACTRARDPRRWSRSVQPERAEPRSSGPAERFTGAANSLRQPGRRCLIRLNPKRTVFVAVFTHRRVTRSVRLPEPTRRSTTHFAEAPSWARTHSSSRTT